MNATWVYASAAAALVCVGVAAGWKLSEWTRVSPLERQILEARAASAAADSRYRTLEKEAMNAQAHIIDHYRSERAAADRDWRRLLDAARRASARVSEVPAKPGSPGEDRGDWMEAACGAGDRSLAGDLVTALSVGERLEHALNLCQTELRLCAGLR